MDGMQRLIPCRGGLGRPSLSRALAELVLVLVVTSLAGAQGPKPAALPAAPADDLAAKRAHVAERITKLSESPPAADPARPAGAFPRATPSG